MRLLALDRSDETIVEGLTLVLPCFFLLLVLFGPPAGAFVVVDGCLPLVILVAKESANRLLTGGIVCHDIHQVVDGLWMISA